MVWSFKAENVRLFNRTKNGMVKINLMEGEGENDI